VLARSGRWVSATKQRPWLLGGAIVLTGALVAGGIVLTNIATHGDELAAARQAVSVLGKAEITRHKAEIDLQSALETAHTETGVLGGIVADGAGYSNQDVITRLDAANKTLATNISTWIPDGGDAPVVDVAAPETVTRIIPTNWDTPKIRTGTTALQEATKTVVERTKTLTVAADQLEELTGETDRALVEVAEVSPGTAQALLGTLPSADQPSRDALQTALTALQAGIDMPGLAGLERAYIDAMKAVQASHVAVETQQAIDAAAAADADTYVDPGSGERKPNPNYSGGGNGGSGSGGGGSDGESSGGDSGSGGGGSPAPSPPRIVFSSYACGGAGGYSWGGYNNRALSVPGSGVASYNGPYDDGTGWRVDWTCV
jgi:uncharacterized membrane protein YgcG